MHGRRIIKMERSIRVITSFNIPVVANLIYAYCLAFHSGGIDIGVFYWIAFMYALAMVLLAMLSSMCIFQLALIVNPFLYPIFTLFMPDWAISAITAALVILAIGRFLINRSKT